MALNQFEIAANHKRIHFLVNDYLAAYAIGQQKLLSEEQKQLFSDLIARFAEQHDITLINLRSQEEQALVKILNQSLFGGSIHVDFLNTQLLAWKTRLQIAVAGQDLALKTMHAGAAQDITYDAQHGQVNVWRLGSDRDANRLLRPVLPENISTPGQYVLPAVDVNFGTSLRDHIAITQASIREHDIQGPVTVFVPANYSQENHWRAIRVDFNHGKVVHASEIDSLSGSDCESKVLNAAIQQATQQNVNAKRHYTGKQTNGSSCLDYATQAIFTQRGEHNAITAATTAAQLRKAVANHLAQAAPVANPVPATKPSQQPTTSQQTCDQVLAVELDRIYRENPEVGTPEQERELFNKAQIATGKTLAISSLNASSFFKPVESVEPPKDNSDKKRLIKDSNTFVPPVY